VGGGVRRESAAAAAAAAQPQMSPTPRQLVLPPATDELPGPKVASGCWPAVLSVHGQRGQCLSRELSFWAAMRDSAAQDCARFRLPSVLVSLDGLRLVGPVAGPWLAVFAGGCCFGSWLNSDGVRSPSGETLVEGALHHRSCSAVVGGADCLYCTVLLLPSCVVSPMEAWLHVSVWALPNSGSARHCPQLTGRLLCSCANHSVGTGPTTVVLRVRCSRLDHGGQGSRRNRQLFCLQAVI
jgi:hypothetical protein